jgi:hypothetical protein
MAETQIWRVPRVRVAGSRAGSGSGRRAGSGSGRRLGVRLWALLNAQAVIRGPAGGRGRGWAAAEDDHRRLTAGRGVGHVSDRTH